MKVFKSSDANDLIQLHQTNQFALAEKKSESFIRRFSKRTNFA